MVSKESKIYIAGHRGLVGSAIVRFLKKKEFQNILTVTREELDLRNSENVKKWYNSNEIDYVSNAAARVGGIMANQTPIECLQGIEVSGYLTTNISYHIHDGTQFGSCEIVGTISGIAELQQTIIVHLEDYLTMIGEPLTRVSYNEVKVKTRGALTLSE